MIQQPANIDLNCDMGEGTGNDKQIMAYISSANIACGYHAGDEKTIWDTVELAIEHKVAVGAHVSFFDKNNFGRNEISLPESDIYELITQQLIIMNEITDYFDIPLQHVKPHGALYNMSARDPAIAKIIASAIADFDRGLLLFGLSGSHSITEAAKLGLKTVNEVFSDRSYHEDGSLTPRGQPGALINGADAAIRQVLQIVQEQTVTTPTGKTIPVIAGSICIHSDGEQAVSLARSIHEALTKEGINIKTPL